jgi:hypothetical protein
MSRQSADLEEELETEFEEELEAEGEGEWEQEEEAFLPALGGIANAIGGLLGEEEAEGEAEWEEEVEAETEDEAFLGALGGIARAVGGLLGGGGGGGGGDTELEEEGEVEVEAEAEAEVEVEAEEETELEDEAEEFFGRIRRALGAIRRNPLFRTLAKTAGPLVATAIGGPAAGALARAVTSQLEGELEEEVEAEFEEMATAPLTGGQALGEYLAAQAAASESETEAEAFAGVAAYVALSPQDRRDLERMVPALLRGAAVVTRLLHGNRRTRQAVRLVPGIVDGAARTILRRAAAGQPAGPVEVGRALGAATTRVLGTGPARNAVMRRHARGLAYSRRRYHGYRYGPYGRYGRRRYRPGYGPYGRRIRYGGRPVTQTIRRQPLRSRTVGGGMRVPRPRPGIVRVVTPVRVPARDGRPARTVRVVSDVRVPRGAVPTGRPVSVGGRRSPR